MSITDRERQIHELKEYLGVSDEREGLILVRMWEDADRDLRAKVGNYDSFPELSEAYKRYWVGCLYADRFGELSSKRDSATRQAMENILFELRLLVEKESYEKSHSEP